MGMIDLYHDYNLDYRTEGHKHCRPGWVNVECPFCTGNPGYHLGWNIDENYFYCWRCGKKKPSNVIQELLHVSNKEARSLLRQYLSGHSVTRQKKIKINKKPLLLPSHTGKLSKAHKQYLKGRNFDPDKLEKEWDLKGTGPISTLDKKAYNHRIIAPIYWGGKIASFQGRDITGKTEIKYKACPQDRELIEHKTILYGQQNKWRNVGLGVEGIIDVWRLGPDGVGTFGIEYRPQQVRQIAKHFKRFFVLYDLEPQAQAKAKQLVTELQFRGVDAYNYVVDSEDDVGAMNQKDADHLVNELTKQIY